MKPLPCRTLHQSQSPRDYTKKGLTIRKVIRRGGDFLLTRFFFTPLGLLEFVFDVLKLEFSFWHLPRAGLFF